MPIRVKPFPLAAGHVIAQDFELKPAGLNERVEVKEEPAKIKVVAKKKAVTHTEPDGEIVIEKAVTDIVEVEKPKPKRGKPKPAGARGKNEDAATDKDEA